MFDFLWKYLPTLSAFISVILGLFLTLDCDTFLYFCPYNEKTKPFKGKFVWIAGASSGIGAALAEDFARGGATVILSARRVAQLEEVATKCSQHGNSAAIIPMDILDAESRAAAWERVKADYGQADILVLCAGRGQRGLAVETPLSMTRELLELNFVSFAGLTELVLPTMVQRKSGHIVVISSLSGKIGTPLAASYSAAKYALQGYFDAVRAEVSAEGVSVSVACPGPTESEFFTTRVEAGAGLPTKETKKMPTARCARLIVKGVYHRVDEMWISRQPVLASLYVHVYAPWISRQLYKHVIGPGRVGARRTGADPYDILVMLGLKKTKKASN